MQCTHSLTIYLKQRYIETHEEIHHLLTYRSSCSYEHFGLAKPKPLPRLKHNYTLRHVFLEVHVHHLHV